MLRGYVSVECQRGDGVPAVQNRKIAERRKNFAKKLPKSVKKPLNSGKNRDRISIKFSKRIFSKTIERLRRKAIGSVKWQPVAHLNVMGAL